MERPGMTDESRVQRLLEELLASNGTPEEACRDAPELLAEVRERWKRMQALDVQIEALFPTPQRERGPILRGVPASAAGAPHIAGYAMEGVLGRGGVGVV